MRIIFPHMRRDILLVTHVRLVGFCFVSLFSCNQNCITKMTHNDDGGRQKQKKKCSLHCLDRKVSYFGVSAITI
jgi:hypothetical protein